MRWTRLFLPLLLFVPGVLSGEDQRGAPSDALPTFFAALEMVETGNIERVALFEDGTVVTVEREGAAAPVLKKRQIGQEEKSILLRVISEALRLPEMQQLEARPLGHMSGRKISLEIARPGRESRRFEFDALTPLPVALGRAKGALEDLRSRFLDRRSAAGEDAWDNALLKVGSRVRRRSDGKIFRVVRDDSFSSLVELEEEGRRLEGMKVRRKAAPQIFEEPLPPPQEAGGDR